jgi:hypothetical protein
MLSLNHPHPSPLPLAGEGIFTSTTYRSFKVHSYNVIVQAKRHQRFPIIPSFIPDSSVPSQG